MTIRLHFSLVVRCVCARAVVDGTPTLALIADLALVAFAGFAEKVSAFVGSHPLSFDFLAADPAAVLVIELSQQYVS